MDNIFSQSVLPRVHCLPEMVTVREDNHRCIRAGRWWGNAYMLLNRQGDKGDRGYKTGLKKDSKKNLQRLI